jgi:type I restriction enzyme S subunit
VAKGTTIADLKAYSEYGLSEREWLGQVPAHWNELRAKCLFSEIDERSTTGKEELLSVSHLTGVTPRSQKSITMFLAKSNIGHKVCRPGDVVINTMWAWMGALGVARHTGLVSPAYGVYRPLPDCGILPRYADHLLRTPMYAAEYQCRSTGVNSSRLRLYPEHFLTVPVLVPPTSEQAAIVRFLDWANGRLERAIRARRKVIALLTEQKQVIIHRAVTRGLDRSVPLKPSGIPWLGDVPQHWETPLNQRVFREEIRSHDDSPETQLSLSQRAGLIATRDMQERSLQTASFANWKVTLPGDLVLNRFKAHLGVFFASSLRGIVSFHYGVFAPRRVMHMKYFELLFHTYSYRAIYAGRSNGMTVGLQNLSNQNFYNVRCVVPPVPEQIAITAHAERETEVLNTAISRLEREIDLLREYRTRFIADVVTGKLNVREAAARLPEDATPDTAEDATPDTAEDATGDAADSIDDNELDDEDTAA